MHPNKVKSSLRIHHAERKKRKAFEMIYGNWRIPSHTTGKDEAIQESWLCASKYKDNMTFSSCYYRGNPRRFGNKLTLQERRAIDIANSWGY